MNEHDDVYPKVRWPLHTDGCPFSLDKVYGSWWVWEYQKTHFVIIGYICVIYVSQLIVEARLSIYSDSLLLVLNGLLLTINLIKRVKEIYNTSYQTFNQILTDALRSQDNRYKLIFLIDIDKNKVSYRILKRTSHNWNLLPSDDFLKRISNEDLIGLVNYLGDISPISTAWILQVN